MAEHTGWTLRLFCLTGLSAVVDEHVVKIQPILFGNKAHQISLDPVRIFLLAQPQSQGKTPDMGVDSNALCLIEGTGENDVSRLPGHTGKSDELFHAVRDIAVEIFHDLLADIDEASRFVPEKACWSDHLLQLFLVGSCQIIDSGIFPEKKGSDLVNLLVRALGGQNRGHQNLEWSLKLKGGAALGIGLAQDPDDFSDSLSGTFHLFLSFQKGHRP